MQKSKLIVEVGPTGNRFVLHEDLIMTYDGKGPGRYLVVPKGFTTDFASIPSHLEGTIRKLGPWTAPAVLHDACYWAGPSWGMDRKKADEIFLQTMKEALVSKLHRYLLYYGVRTAGFPGWQYHRDLGHNCLNFTKGE